MTLEGVIKVLKEKGYKFVNQIYGKGVIVEQGGQYGATDYEGNEIIPCQYKDYSDIWSALNEIENKFTINKIISDSIENPNEYVVKIVELLKNAIDFDRKTVFNAGREFKPLFDDDTYRKVILSLYEIASEIVEKGETYSFILYNYGGRSEEYNALREKLSQMTGLPADYFKSAVEHSMRREDYFNGGMFGRSDHFITMAKLKMQKPQVIISPERASYCSDISESEENPPIVITNERAVSLDDSDDGR